MRKWLSITGITLMQGIRTQTFWLTGLLFVFLLFVAFVLRVLSIGQRDLMLRSFGLSAMEISALLLVVYGFAFSFFRERDSRLQMIYLTFVSPGQYLFGKLAGICLTVLLYLGLASLFSAGLLVFEHAWSWSFCLGVYSIFLKLCIVCAFCILFSALFSSPVFASLMTVFLYVASELSYYPLAVMKASASELTHGFYRVLYHLLPNLDKLDLKSQAIYGNVVSEWYLVQISLYTLFYASVVFFVALTLFSRKEH